MTHATEIYEDSAKESLTRREPIPGEPDTLQLRRQHPETYRVKCQSRAPSRRDGCCSGEQLGEPVDRLRARPAAEIVGAVKPVGHLGGGQEVLQETEHRALAEGDRAQLAGHQS